MSLIAGGRVGGARRGPLPTSQLESPIQETVLLVQLDPPSILDAPLCLGGEERRVSAKTKLPHS